MKTSLALALALVSSLCACTTAQQHETQNGANQIYDAAQGAAKNARPEAADAALVARVTAAIVGQSGVNAFHVSATARDGIVTLNGSVPTPSVKRTILDSVQRTKGVRSVVDRITLRP